MDFQQVRDGRRVAPPNPHSVAMSYFLRSDPLLPSASVRRLCRPYDAQDQVSTGFRWQIKPPVV